MGLIGVYSFFEDMPTLEASVTSLLPYVDRLVCLDGKYKDFPGDHELSQDGSREFLDSVGAEVYNVVGLTEPEKRSHYFIGEDGDYYLHLDGDEILEGELLWEPGVFDVGVFSCYRSSDKRPYRRARLFRHVPGLHYYAKHYWIRDEEGRTFALLREAGDYYRELLLEGAEIYHEEHRRNPYRRRDKLHYYDALRARERNIQEVR